MTVLANSLEAIVTSISLTLWVPPYWRSKFDTSLSLSFNAIPIIDQENELIASSALTPLEFNNPWHIIELEKLPLSTLILLSELFAANNISVAVLTASDSPNDSDLVS